jgi:hypothetical protein
VLEAGLLQVGATMEEAEVKENEDSFDCDGLSSELYKLQGCGAGLRALSERMNE